MAPVRIGIGARCTPTNLHVVREWIEFHRLVGVTRFYVHLDKLSDINIGPTCGTAGAAQAYRSEPDADMEPAQRPWGVARQLLQPCIDTGAVRLVHESAESTSLVQSLRDVSACMRTWARRDGLDWFADVGDVTTFLVPRSLLSSQLTSACVGGGDYDGETKVENEMKSVCVPVLALVGLARAALHAKGPAECFVSHLSIATEQRATRDPVMLVHVSSSHAAPGTFTLPPMLACRCALSEAGASLEGSRFGLLAGEPELAAELRTLLVPRLAVCMHVGYAAEWPYYASYLANVPEAYDLYVTVAREQLLTPYGAGLDAVVHAIDGVHPSGVSGAATFVTAIENRGMDVAGWLRAVELMQRAGRRDRVYDLVLKLHTKSALNLGPHWRHALVASILGSPTRAAACIARLVATVRHPSNDSVNTSGDNGGAHGRNQRCLLAPMSGQPCLSSDAREAGMVGAADWLLVERRRQVVTDAGVLMGMPAKWLDELIVFFGGTMFWARARPLFALLCPDARRARGLPPFDFDAIVARFPHGRDLSRGEGLAHFSERTFGPAILRGAGLALVGVREEPRLRQGNTMPRVEISCSAEQYLCDIDPKCPGALLPLPEPAKYDGDPFALDAAAVAASRPLARPISCVVHPHQIVPAFARACTVDEARAHVTLANMHIAHASPASIAPFTNHGTDPLTTTRTNTRDTRDMLGEPLPSVPRDRLPEAQSSPTMRADVAAQRARMVADAKEARVFIEMRYESECARNSDINEHLPIIHAYARQCRHVTECGVRATVSTWAVMLALAQVAEETGTAVGDVPPSAGTRPNAAAPRYVGIDAEWDPNMGGALVAARRVGLRVEYRVVDDDTTTIEPTDMLFIDTWHVRGHLARELEAHAPRVRRFIVMHDTEVDAHVGESVRMRHDIAREMAESGLCEVDIRGGMQVGVDAFLAVHVGEWQLRERLINNNGLTVLERMGGMSAAD